MTSASLSQTYPALAQQWSELNEKTPEEVTHGSHYEALWKCSAGHEWAEKVYNRATKRTGCPVCSGRQTLIGFNDLQTTHPNIAAEWSPQNQVNVTEVTAGSSKKVLWVCSLGHKYQSVVAMRTSQRSGCPYCKNSKVLPGFNDLETVNPTLTSEWSEKNTFLPSSVVEGSGKKALWECSEGHEWEARIASRSKQGRGCPYCAKQRPVVGVTDLKTTHPDLLAEWGSKNSTPEQYTPGSNVKAEWVCKLGHVWSARIADRIRYNSLCPICNHPSAPEGELTEFIQSLGLEVQRNVRQVNNMEVDLFIPAANVAIEYNGLYWHSELRKHRNSHYNKWKAYHEAGIQLIQIWEDQWLTQPELVKNMIAHKLNRSTQGRAYARKLTSVRIPTATAKAFLDQHHIQGHAAGTYYVGLVNPADESDVKAVMVMKQAKRGSDTELSLVRYATSVTVVGGFTKLLTHVERTFSPETVVTFADHCVSDGGLYEHHGFVATAEVPPDYMYVVGKERKHKFGYRKKRFRNDPGLKYEEGLSESELASLNQLPKIWDAGKTRYTKEYLH